MSSPDARSGFWGHLAACNAHDPSRFEPWWIGETRVGCVRRDRIPRLLRASALFARDDAGRLVARTIERRALDEGFAALALELAREGEIARTTGELYAVSEQMLGEPLAAIDRGAAPWFGIAAGGVHLNGFVRRADGLWIWVATRSRTKPLHPGQLDNLVAGGQPLGLTLEENLVKECAEEAALPAELARRAIAVGAVRYCFEDERGLKSDTMHCYDLELPESFVPRNTDGEVERFELLPAVEVVRLVRETQRFKFNCNLVLLDFFLRHGLLAEATVEQAALRRALQRGFGDTPPRFATS
ncbi:MAG: DUF4743 domain-containing protein [Planctomycetes bacterium]|nr:DUF4743 domain-containing protein [Planctomycetota bacterium]